MNALAALETTIQHQTRSADEQITRIVAAVLAGAEARNVSDAPLQLYLKTLSGLHGKV